MLRLGFLSCLLLLTACDAPVVGLWESDAKLGNGERNKLEVIDDTTGDAKIWATTCAECADWVRFKFDFDWEDQGLEFDFKMECKDGPCDGADFKMECEVIEEEGTGEEKMDCKGDGDWASYAFDWQRDE
jgi:hypothetical protein